MATKADFAPEEWDVLRFAVLDTMTYVAMVDPGFWATFKEATATAKFIAASTQTSQSQLVKDLANDVRGKKDEALKANPTNMEGETLERLGEAVKLVAAKAPDDLGAFREFVLGIGTVAAEASEGTRPVESAALEKIQTALEPAA